MPQKPVEVEGDDKLPSAKYFRDRAARCSDQRHQPRPEIREIYLRMARSYLLMGKDLEGRRKRQKAGRPRSPGPA